MELVGYARVSSQEERQVLDRQVDALRAVGCERIYDDRGSGASADRLGLNTCLDYQRRLLADVGRQERHPRPQALASREFSIIRLRC